MSNSISIWKDKILLSWDGTMPPGYGPHDHVEIQDMPKIWKHLKGHCSYNKTLKKFVLFFSKQNLVRLRSQFGSIPIVSGYDRVTELKGSCDSLMAMREFGERVKQGEFCDLNIDYKLPPLAEYQKRGTAFLYHLYKAPLFADCGCLAGGSMISFKEVVPREHPRTGEIVTSPRWNGHIKELSLEDLYYRLKGGKSRNHFYVLSFTGKLINRHRLKKVVQSGMKNVVLLMLKGGKNLTLTPDHEVMTKEGFVEAAKLKPGTSVMIFQKVNPRGSYGNSRPSYDEVVSVVPLPGKVMTYDIVCEDPHRNFVANGIVVHNCGKTYMVLVSTEQQIKTGRLQRGKTLVCGKLATLETGWAADTKKFTDLKANVLWAPPGKKRKEKILEKLNEEADLYVINHEGVKVFMEELAAKKFEKVVVDESTILKSFTGLHSRISGGVLGKAIMTVAEHATYRVIMSGTPAPNGPEDLWGQFHFLDPDGILLEAGFKDFRQQYMERIVFGRLKKDKDGNDIPGEPENRNTPSKWVMTKGAEKIIHSIIDPHVFRVRIRDHLKDLPPKTVVKRAIQMKPSQQKIYDEVQKELWVFLKDGKVSTENALTELIKLRQVTGGFLIADDGEPRPLDDNPKLEMMDQLLNDEIDHKHKVVIFAQYRWEIEMLQNRYKDHGVVTVYGGNTGNNNLKNLNTFMEDPKCRIIILHPRSAAHGITLTMAHYMIFYSVSYSSEENYQSVARIERASQKNPMFVYYLLAKTKKGFSIDEIIYKVLISKQRKQELLLDLKQEDIDSDILSTWKNQFG